ncbi:MAG: NADH-quinone oxidoreductase subunit NuoE [Theionarchaea archaeon]|nr:NADH-quinone oxidoreductase subunit NuoE [Theionarchaea archaeon]
MDHESRTKQIHTILQEFEPERENLIAILHRIQDTENFHYITQEAVKAISDYLHLTPSEIIGVISFYTMFSLNPRGKYVIRVCTSAPCHIMGSTTIIDALKEILGITVGETTGNNLFTLEFSSCLGVCDRAPAIMINHEVYGNLTYDSLKKVIGGKV